MNAETLYGVLRVLSRIEAQLVGIKKRLATIQHGAAEIRSPENAKYLENFKNLVAEHRSLIECQREALRELEIETTPDP